MVAMVESGGELCTFVGYDKQTWRVWEVYRIGTPEDPSGSLINWDTRDIFVLRAMPARQKQHELALAVARVLAAQQFPDADRLDLEQLSSLAAGVGWYMRRPLMALERVKGWQVPAVAAAPGDELCRFRSGGHWWTVKLTTSIRKRDDAHSGEPPAWGDISFIDWEAREIWLSAWAHTHRQVTALLSTGLHVLVAGRKHARVKVLKGNAGRYVSITLHVLRDPLMRVMTGWGLPRREYE